MAGIDKTFVSSWKDYKEIRDWALSVGTVDDDYENRITPINWFYYPDLTEEKFNDGQTREWERAKKRYSEKDGKKYYQYYINRYGEDFINNPELFFEVVIWNTSELFDIWLMRHCPLKIIQNRLKEQYGEKYIKEVLEKRTRFDTFVREYNFRPHFKIEKILDDKYSGDDIKWWVEPVEETNSESPYFENPLSYYEVEGSWHFEFEAYLSPKNTEWTSNICCSIHGKLSEGKIYRILRKWGLPSGVKLRFRGISKGLVIKEFILTIK